MQDNPAYFTTMDAQPQIALSSNPAYSTVHRDNQQPLQDKPTCQDDYRSVVSLEMIGKGITKQCTACTDFQDWQYI